MMTTTHTQSRPFFHFLNQLFPAEQHLPNDILVQFENSEFFDLSFQELSERISALFQRINQIPGRQMPSSVIEKQTRIIKIIHNSYCFYLGHFDLKTPITSQQQDDYRHNFNQLGNNGDDYQPALMTQLLSTVSKNITYSFLAHFKNQSTDEFRNHIEGIGCDFIRKILEERHKTVAQPSSTRTSKTSLRNILLNLGYFMDRLPHVLSQRIKDLNHLKLLLASDELTNTIHQSLIDTIHRPADDGNKSSLLSRFTSKKEHAKAAPQGDTTAFEETQFQLLTSLDDAHRLFKFILKQQQNRPRRLMGGILGDNTMSCDFLDKLISCEIRACDMLQRQFESLLSKLATPGKIQLDKLEKIKAAFFSETNISDMSMEATVLRLGNTHKDKNLIKAMKNHLVDLSEESLGFEQISLQNSILTQLGGNTYKYVWKKSYTTLVQGIFDALPALCEKQTVVANINMLINCLNKRIDELSDNTDTADHTAISDVKLPLFSLTTIMTQSSMQVYLRDDQTIESLTASLRDIIGDNVFVESAALERSLDPYLTPLPRKELEAVVFEINLLKLTHQFLENIAEFCVNKAQPYLSKAPSDQRSASLLFKNQLSYFHLLIEALTNNMLCLRSICSDHIANTTQFYPTNFDQLELVLSELGMIEQQIRHHQFILHSASIRANQHDKSQDTYFATESLANTRYYLKQMKPFEAFTQLDSFYRIANKHLNDQKMQEELNEIEEDLTQQIVSLLHNTHIALFVTMPSEILFDLKSHSDGQHFIERFKRYPNKLGLFIQNTILDERHTVFSRSKAYARWLHVASELRAKHDFLGYFAITLALDNLKVLKAITTLFDQQTVNRFSAHVKLHKDSTPIVLTALQRNNIAPIPWPEDFMGSLEKLPKTKQLPGHLGYLCKNDARLYGQTDAHYQVIYRIYQQLHQTLLAYFESSTNDSDWQAHLDHIQRFEVSRDSNCQRRETAKIVEKSDQEQLSQAPHHSRRQRRSIWTQMDDKRVIMHLAELITTMRIPRGLGNAIFSQGYINIKTLGQTRKEWQEILARQCANTLSATRLDAYSIGLFANIEAFTLLFNLLKGEQFQSINEIDLHSNMPNHLLPKERSRALAQLLPHIADYETVRLHNNHITNALFAEFTRSLKTLLKQNKMQIRQLSLNNNLLYPGNHGPGGFHLANILKKFNRLTFLDINCNFFSEVDAALLAEALSGCESLKQIDLGYNAIGDVGMQTLGPVLADLPCLETVKLACCKLSEDSVDMIAHMINHGKTIITLKIDGNNRDTYRNYFTQLHDSLSMSEPDIHYTGMSEESVMYLSSLLTLKQDSILAKANEDEQSDINIEQESPETLPSSNPASMFSTTTTCQPFESDYNYKCG